MQKNVRIALDAPVSEGDTPVAISCQDTKWNDGYELADINGPNMAVGVQVTHSASVTYNEEEVRTFRVGSPTPMIRTRTAHVKSVTSREVERTVVVTTTATPGSPASASRSQWWHSSPPRCSYSAGSTNYTNPLTDIPS